MATVPVSPSTATQEQPTPRKKRRRKTSHLKLVPETRELRESLRQRAREVAMKLDKSLPLTKDQMEVVARRILDESQLPEGYLGWTMVVLSSAFWSDQIAAVPPERRLFLLPHCLKHAEGCPADYDEFGLDCRQCGACSIADFRSIAEDMGYKVLVAEGSPIVLKIIVSGHVDAIVGVACLNVLEKAIDKILLAGIPCMAVPLLSSDCRNTSVDEDWVHEMIQLRHEGSTDKTRSYVHLLRAASHIFEVNELGRLGGRRRSKVTNATQTGSSLALDPVAGTEQIAFDFLARGGKYARPFITLAAYDALNGDLCTTHDGDQHAAGLSDAIRRTALSIETFHKASLVHDDIEDDDQFRYGADTLHKKYGTPTAINVGDYLIGLGYRLVSREVKQLGAETTSDILDLLADAHLRLSEGQGAELIWRDARDKQLKPLDALKIYALKTAPAFEAAFLSGMRLAGPIDDYRDSVKAFARNMGVAFQILNDLQDWKGDEHNKLQVGADTSGGRPTVLWALALEGLPNPTRDRLLELAGKSDSFTEADVNGVRQLYHQADVFEKARRLVEKHRDRAEAIADEVQPDSLRRLMYYLIDTVLESQPAEPPVVMPSLPTELVISRG